MVRVAIIGAGGYGWQLIRHIQRLSEPLDCRLIAAADTRWAKLPEHRWRLLEAGVALYGDALEMLDALRGRCEAVYIATGIPSHAALAIAAAERGYHIHLEKPPAATVQEVDRMADALARAARCCLVGFQAAHKADIHFVKQRIASGRMGRVEALACHVGWPRTALYYARNDWAGRLRSPEGWVLDGPATNALAHQITNLLLLATGEPNRLAAPTAVRAELYAAAPIEGHDTAAIEIHTDAGPRAYLLASHASERANNPVITIAARKATAVWHYKNGATITYNDGGRERCEGDEGLYDGMVANFMDAVRSGEGSLLRCGLAEARKMVAALDGAHESSGRIHRIDPPHAVRMHEGGPRQRTVVRGLDALMAAAAARPGLFSDLDPPPPWSRTTQPFDLTGYDHFPQRFACH
jgi:predicted dehydrogenase